MSGINICIIKGNLTRDPELTVLSTGTPVCGFCVAINSRFTKQDGSVVEKVDYIDVVVWNKPGENCAKYLERGQEVFVHGRLQLDSWEDSEGNKRRKLKCVAKTVDFGRKPNNAKRSDSEMAGGENVPEGTPPPESEQDSRAEKGPEEIDENIPF